MGNALVEFLPLLRYLQMVGAAGFEPANLQGSKGCLLHQWNRTTYAGAPTCSPLASRRKWSIMRDSHPRYFRPKRNAIAARRMMDKNLWGLPDSIERILLPTTPVRNLSATSGEIKLVGVIGLEPTYSRFQNESPTFGTTLRYKIVGSTHLRS